MKFGVRALAAVVVCLLAVTGCSSSSAWPEPTSTPTPTITYPATGAPLASAGYTNPVAADIWVPYSTVLTYTADQPNLVIAVGKLDQAQAVEKYLQENLPTLGWTITGQAEGALTFTRGEWRGGYAQGPDEWALTVRND